MMGAMTACLNFVRRNGRHALRLGGLFLFATVVGACSILPTGPVLQVYLLPSEPASPFSGGANIDSSLRIIEPNSNQFLNSSRIAVQPQGEEIAVYEGSRWSDPAPILLRNRLIQEFRGDSRIRAVSSDDDSLQADFELSGDLIAFQGVAQTDKSEVLIRFDARLVRAADRRIVASQSFEIRQPINGHSEEGTAMNDVVQAFGLASDKLSAQVLNWALRRIAN